MLLKGVIQKLNSDFGLTPVTAAELEFYLFSSHWKGEDSFWQLVQKACASSSIFLEKYEAERGDGQYEIALTPAAPEKTISDLVAIKKIISDAAEACGARADFSARPKADQPGSGLHVHVHLADSTSKNVFYKDDFTISDALKFSIGGLLANMQKDRCVFAPNPESYQRFIAGGNAPTTVSWGANNRTVAVRLPDTAHDKKRIEHRVSGADADPESVITAILSAMHDGLTRRLDPGPQIYGDASLAMYGLPPLLKN